MSRSIMFTISTVALLFMPVTSTIASTKAITNDVIGSVGDAVSQNNPACRKQINISNVYVSDDLFAENLGIIDMSVVDTSSMCNAEINVSGSTVKRKVVARNGSKVTSTLIK